MSLYHWRDELCVSGWRVRDMNILPLAAYGYEVDWLNYALSLPIWSKRHKNPINRALGITPVESIYEALNGCKGNKGVELLSYTVYRITQRLNKLHRWTQAIKEIEATK